MRAGVLSRSVLLAADLGLFAGLAGLLAATFLGSGLPAIGVKPRQLAIDSSAGPAGDPARWALIAAQLDRFRPPPEPPPPPPRAAPTSGLLAAWNLKCVFVDPADPRRCSAIVGPAGEGAQASIGQGDPFAGGEVIGIEVERAGDETRLARVRVRYPHAVEALEMTFPPRPS